MVDKITTEFNIIWMSDTYELLMVRRDLNLLLDLEKNKEVLKLREKYPSLTKYEIGKKAEKNILKKEKVNELFTHYLDLLRTSPLN